MRNSRSPGKMTLVRYFVYVFFLVWGDLSPLSSGFVHIVPTKPISGLGHRVCRYQYLQLSQGPPANRVHKDNDDPQYHIDQDARSNSQSNFDALQNLPDVPIFPLRKFPRFPTDRLTLNLYEERYLQMADSILSARPSIFGAIFVSGKPHLVTNGGTGSIVPMLQRGDIGTLFLVNDCLDDTLPTSGNAVQAFQRRVRLSATGFARFRISDIVSDGTASVRADFERKVTSNSQGSSEQGRPYIQANLTLLCDQDDSSTKAWSQHEYEKIVESFRKCNQRDNQASMDPILEFSQICSAISCDASNEYISFVPNYGELFSFFSLSKLVNAKRKSPAVLVSYLESLSTRERIQRIIDIIRAL